jgi:hypothetical protein
MTNTNLPKTVSLHSEHGQIATLELSTRVISRTNHFTGRTETVEILRAEDPECPAYVYEWELQAVCAAVISHSRDVVGLPGGLWVDGLRAALFSEVSS